MTRASLLLLPLALSGCVSPANDRLTIDQTVRMETSTAASRPSEPPRDEILSPSVTGIDRSNWQPTTILIPVDGTWHFPTYAKHYWATDRTARQRGQYPTAQQALELVGGSEDEQELEALLNQLRALEDVVLLPLRALFVQRPWTRRLSPDEAFQRCPRLPATQPEPAGPPREPFAPPPPQRITP